MRTAIVVALIGLGLSGVANSAATDWCRYGQLPVPESRRESAATAAGAHTLAIFYAVPTDVPYNSAVLARVKRAAADVQAWYQCASGGITWEFAYPETVRVYYGLQNRLYYKDNGDWWGSLLGEMGGAGLPIWSSGTVTAIWAHGAGWWAGAAQFCGVDCGTALFGVEVFPEFNNPAYSGGTCPGGTGVSSWPCTPEGAFAHELGHTLGLPHPADVPATSAAAPHSVMQTHWNYPNYAPPTETPWGFLSFERQTLLANPFMKWGLPIRQSYAGCDVVNLPSSGAAPVAAFALDAAPPPNTFHGINTSSGAAYSYWMFGDGSTANTTDGLHTYSTPGNYLVTLRSMAGNAMVDTASSPLPIVGVSAQLGRVIALTPSTPNPFARSTTCALELPASARVDLAVYEITGRCVRSLVSGSLDAGRWPVTWDGHDAEGRAVSAGVYFIRLRTGGRSISQPVVLRN